MIAHKWCTYIRIHWRIRVLVSVSCVSIKYSYYSGRLELIELLDAVFISSRRRHRRSRAAKISQFPDKVHSDIYIRVR